MDNLVDNISYSYTKNEDFEIFILAQNHTIWSWASRKISTASSAVYEIWHSKRYVSHIKGKGRTGIRSIIEGERKNDNAFEQGP